MSRPDRSAPVAVAEPPTELPRTLRLAEGAELLERDTEDAVCVARAPDGRYVRVAADMERLLRALDGRRTAADLARELGPRWTVEAVEAALFRLIAMRLLETGAKPPRPRGSKLVTFVPPLTVQLTVLRPERLFARLQPVIAVLLSRYAVAAALVVVLGGLVALVVQGARVHDALGHPLPVAVLLAVAAASFVTSALHEFGHGAALAHHGGRPSRLGMMLFYLSPAFFCDVTDGWRLGDRTVRVRVALAGILVQLVVAAVAALAALAVPGPWGSALLVLAVTTTVTGLMNLIPFVKLDGYIALMSHVDVPFLRERSMTDARRSVARVLYGGRYERELPQVTWAVPFGLASLVFPAVLVLAALRIWFPIILGLGILGAAVVISGLAVAARFAVRATGRLLAEARAAGTSALRRRVVTTLVVVLGCATLLVPVPYTMAGGFEQDDGHLSFVVAQSADLDALAPGTPVTLARRGVVTSTELGTTAVGSEAPRDGTAPLAALLPVAASAAQVPVVLVPLEPEIETGESVGSAVADLGTRPLGTWLYLNYFAQLWR